MRIHNKNNATDKDIWCTKQDKVNPENPNEITYKHDELFFQRMVILFNFLGWINMIFVEK